MTELLAPAGSAESLKAAIAGGAKAVYLGGKTFSARAFADNFTLEEIRAAVQLAHFWNVKIYVAVNTLVSDDEMMSAVFYAAELYRAGVDAVIVQDLGLLDLLLRALPDLPVHASTQMSIHNAAGCNLLEQMGLERVILARELSLADMRQLRGATGIGLETFVHGALCVCYSGQCLFSSLVGGRSGNRGRCAQPCRMAYNFVNEYGEPYQLNHKGNYLLSPRDLIGYESLDELYQVGMDSWKIEGRMKKAEYVATVCRLYSEALRQLEESSSAENDPDGLRQLLQVFNRDHCQGYWHGNPGASLMSYSRPNNRGVLVGRIAGKENSRIKIRLVQPLHLGDMLEIWQSGKGETLTVSEMYYAGSACEQGRIGDIVEIPAAGGRENDRVFKIFDFQLMEAARSTYLDFQQKPLHFVVSATLGEAISIKAFDEDGYSSESKSEYVVEKAINSASDMTSVRVQLGRLGNTGYSLGEVTGEIDKGIMIPSSVLNKCRRALTDDLLYQRQQKDMHQFDQVRFAKAVKNSFPEGKTDKKIRGQELAALVADPAQAKLAAQCGIKDIYFDAMGFVGRSLIDYRHLAEEMGKNKARLIPYLPQIIMPREEEGWRKRIAAWKNYAIPAVIVNNLSQIAMLKEEGWQERIYVGSGINCFNSLSAVMLAKQGVSRICLSPEMTLDQMRALKTKDVELEVFAQGALQLMVSESCALGSLIGERDMANKQPRLCKRPCLDKGRKYHLRDEKGFVFPVRFDPACRMHVFNSREHCLLKEMDNLKKAGISHLLLDMRLYDDLKAKRLLNCYHLAVGDELNFAEAKQRITTMVQDYTKGHLYRGV